jgi:anti-sigma factor ChrR (cupin superfamily)
MQIRSDFSKQALVRPGECDFVPSPHQGVDRLMLDRVGAEIARATSCVRFGRGSFFPHHEHGGGEEIFVLEGELEDEHGRYPTGTYLRDPIGSSHTPFSKNGCIIYVKLWQFAVDDKERIAIESAAKPWQHGGTEGVSLKSLHEFTGVSTFLLRLAPGLRWPHALDAKGEETFVLEGSFSTETGHYPQGTWLREPGGNAVTYVTETGCTLLVKTGHLSPQILAAEAIRLKG